MYVMSQDFTVRPQKKIVCPVCCMCKEQDVLLQFVLWLIYSTPYHERMCELWECPCCGYERKLDVISENVS